MDLVIISSLLVAVVSLVVYAISTNAKVVELARLSYACGLLAFLLRFATETAVRLH